MSEAVVAAAPSSGHTIEALAEQYRKVRAASDGDLPTTAVAEQPVVVQRDTAEPGAARPLWRRAMDELNRFVKDNPAAAMATAAGVGFVAGKKMSRPDQPAAVPQPLLARLVAGAGGGVVSLIGIHAALAHLPGVVSQVADILAQSPGLVTGELTALTVGLGVAAALKIGHVSMDPGRGMTVEALVGRIMDRYDRNNDGILSLAGNDDAFNASATSERVITNNLRSWSSGYDVQGSYDYYRAPKVTKWQMSIGPLLKAADTDDDQQVSRADLEKLLRTYAADGSNSLSKKDLKRLQQELPETKSGGKTVRSNFHWNNRSELVADWPDSDDRFAIAKLHSVYDLK